jgi:hypothetical protein
MNTLLAKLNLKHQLQELMINIKGNSLEIELTWIREALFTKIIMFKNLARTLATKHQRSCLPCKTGIKNLMSTSEIKYFRYHKMIIPDIVCIMPRALRITRGTVSTNGPKINFIIVNVSITFRLIASFYLWTVSYMNIWQRTVYLSNTFLLWLSIDYKIGKCKQYWFAHLFYLYNYFTYCKIVSFLLFTGLTRFTHRFTFCFYILMAKQTNRRKRSVLRHIYKRFFSKIEELRNYVRKTERTSEQWHEFVKKNK